jgi:acyl-CoA synthetase (AMP-forming)/AMP-acid ligase II
MSTANNGGALWKDGGTKFVAYRGEIPKAFVVLKADFQGEVTEKEMLDWCKGNMAAYKAPRFMEFRAELPKSAAGKLLRRALVDEEKAKPA